MRRKELYAPIHCRTYYSLLRGILSPEEVADRAAAMGAGAVGIVDINGFYGLIRFARAALERGLKPLYGTSLYDGEEYLCTLLCLDRGGFARANSILSRHIAAQAGSTFATDFSARPEISSPLGSSGREDISSDTEAPVRRESAVPEGKESEKYDPVEDLVREGWRGLWIISNRRDVLTRLLQRSGEGLFAGLEYGLSYSALRGWAKRAGLGVFAYNDAVYAGREDLPFYRVLRAVGLNRLVDSVSVAGGLTEAKGFAQPEDMRRFFSGVPEALTAAEDYVRLAEGFRFPDRFIFPSFRGLSEEASFRQLRQLCLDGIHRRYGVDAGVLGRGEKENAKEALGKRIISRLGYELNIIRHKGFSSYFLVVHDIVRRVPCTCGRGSAAAGIVSYLLGITHVDPLEHNLFFERFLNMGRKDPPDIDVDFPWDERDSTLRYVFETYPASSAMVADHVTFARRSAIREPARVLGYGREETNRLSQLWIRGRMEDLPEELRGVVPRLYGMPRYIGTHPGGVVITPGPITEYTHVQPSPLGRPVIAWEKDGAEDAGLVKIDLLGNRSLGVLRDSIAELNSRYGMAIDWERFSPLKNSATREMIAAGDTLGVFYVESPATRQLLQKMGRGDYEHLVIASSIIRPAANRYIHEYVRRLKGGPYRRFPPPVDELLEENCGIMVYQEDVSRTAIAVAGFDAAEADALRKVLSKRDRELRLPRFRKRFFRGGLERGFTPEVLEELWDAVLSFDGYSFCKPHSASYALLSYRLAWMKRFFPLPFYVAVINNAGGFYSRQVYLNAVRRMGFAIHGPDVNHSCAAYIAEADGEALRVGLAQLRDLDEGLARLIPEERKRNGFYRSVHDLCRRTAPDMGSFRSLVRSGALDSIAEGRTRPQLFWIFYHREAESSLFPLPPVPGLIGDYSRQLKLLDEYRSTGLILSRHPLEIFMPRLSRYRQAFLQASSGGEGECLQKSISGERGAASGGSLPLIDSRYLREYVGKEVRIAGFLVTEKEVPTRLKKRMSFVSFEDPFGIFETVFFPETYGLAEGLLQDGIAFLLEGTVAREWEAVQVSVRRLFPLSRSQREGGARKKLLPRICAG
jgi:error-prone DNA polymerase